MKILFCASETTPFAKTGGLADVAGALPKALNDLGHDARVAMPLYGSIDREKYNLKPIMRQVGVHFFPNNFLGDVYEGRLPGSDVPIYFFAQDQFFKRKGLYSEGGKDYPDNHLRFAWFNMALLVFIKSLQWRPHTILANDWQTGPLPVYLRSWDSLNYDPFYSNTKIVFVIHNLAYQGAYGREILSDISLSEDLYHYDALEFYGGVNYMKGGLIFSDHILTVSPQYALEIQTAEYGCGMDGVLRARADEMGGILNGVDYSLWNPETDKAIATNYGPESLELKGECKADLQREFGLPVEPDVPVMGMITRLAAQKGLDLIEEADQALAKTSCQWVFLGTGDELYETFLQKMAEKYPEKFGVRIAFSEALARKIVAGSDALLIPSRYEPCGLTQMYAMKYGTLPLARRTGGLADSIASLGEDADRNGATGFLFTDHTSKAFVECVRRAVSIYQDFPETWRQLQRNSVAQDFSWGASARKYADVIREVRLRVGKR